MAGRSEPDVRPAASLLSLSVDVAYGAVLVGGFLGLAFAARKSAVLLFSLALIALPLLPAVYVMRFSPGIEMVQDRYMYLPTVGFCLLIGWIAKQTHPWRTRLVAAVCAAVVIFAVLCFAQEGFYANQTAMYARTAEVVPNDQYVQLQLANAYAQDRKFDLALAEYQRACSHFINADCIAGLAEGFYFTHRYAEALPRLQMVARLYDRTDSGRNPTTLIQHEQFLTWLADTQRQLSRSAEAEETEKRAQAIASRISSEPEAFALARAFKVR